MTIASKLEKLCPCFERLHILYGERHNVRPPSEVHVGLPGRTEVTEILPEAEHEFKFLPDSQLPHEDEEVQEHERESISLLYSTLY